MSARSSHSHIGSHGGRGSSWKIVSLGYVGDRKSTRLNSSHVAISYAVFCLKKKKFKGPAPGCPGGRCRHPVHRADRCQRRGALRHGGGALSRGHLGGGEGATHPAPLGRHAD